MKRAIALILITAFLFCGCAKTNKEDNSKVTTDQKLIGMWITYNELKDMAQSEAGFDAAFTQAMKNAQSLKINTVFVHTRAFCDAVYKSDLFPLADYVKEVGDAALQTMINIAHKNGIKLHAWINPYRVSNRTTDYNQLPENSPVRQWLTDDDKNNDKNVCFTESGIYLNPAESEAKKLVIDGVREILMRYDVDGIHIDDYFYPTTDAGFDKLSYDEYATNTENPFDLALWRRKNVSSLINSIFCTVKAHNRDMPFGVSPAADLEHCYNDLYADVEGWINAGYIDYIMPQLYFGFEYPSEEFRFDALLYKWMDLVKYSNVVLYCGLPSYKIGTDSPNDKQEWNEKTDIIARQIKLLDENAVNGYVYFSYSSLFSKNELNRNQLNNIKEKME